MNSKILNSIHAQENTTKLNVAHRQPVCQICVPRYCGLRKFYWLYRHELSSCYVSKTVLNNGVTREQNLSLQPHKLSQSNEYLMLTKGEILTKAYYKQKRTTIQGCRHHRAKTNGMILITGTAIISFSKVKKNR